MADSTIEKVLLFGGLGIAGWWIYSTFFSGASAAASSSVSTPGGTGTGAGSGSGSAAPPSSPAPYSGPTLAQLYSALQSAVNAAFGSDTQLSCPGVAPGANSNFITGGQGSPLPGASTIERTLMPRPTYGVITVPPRTGTGGSGGSSLSGLGDASCTPVSIQASYDVFNWYLQYRAGLPSTLTPPSPPDHTTKVSLAQYWSWAAPLLQAQTSGLSGLRGRGMGHIANIRSIVLGGAA